MSRAVGAARFHMFCAVSAARVHGDTAALLSSTTAPRRTRSTAVPHTRPCCASASEMLTPEEVDQLVMSRLPRQAVLTRERPPLAEWRAFVTCVRDGKFDLHGCANPRRRLVWGHYRAVMFAADDARWKDAALRVAALTMVWFLSVPPLVLWSFFASLSFEGSRNPDADKGRIGFLVAGILTVLLPLVAGVLAVRGRRPVLGGVYLLLALLMLIPGGMLTIGAGRTLVGPPDKAPVTTPAATGGCQEHSGGDTRCPGG